MRKMMTIVAALLSFAISASASEPPLACNLGGLTAAERKQHEALTHKLFASVVDRSETSDGYAFRLDRSRVSLAEVGEWIEVERRCCPFFDFHLDLARNDGPLTLRLGGRPGVREFIAAELGLAAAQK